MFKSARGIVFLSSDSSYDDDVFFDVVHAQPPHNTPQASFVVSILHAFVETTSLSDDSLVRKLDFCFIHLNVVYRIDLPLWIVWS